MAAPTITTFTSLQLYTVGKAIKQLAFFATDTPTSWAATGTPAGLSFNTTTGILTGTPTTPGLSTLSVTATNGTGTSAAVLVPIYIEASEATDLGEVLLNADLDESGVWNPRATSSEFPGVFAKYGNKLLIALGMVRQGELQKMDITEIEVWLRDNPLEKPCVQLWTGAPLAPTDDDAPRYQFTLNFDLPGIKSMIAAHEGDRPPNGTPRQLSALADITITWTAPDVDGSGTVTLIRTFKNLAIHLAGRMEG